MMLQKKVNYGFNGYKGPAIPKASRSIRGRGTIKKKPENNQIQAFEILANVAGNFLQESENSGLDNVASAKDPHTFSSADMKDKLEDERGSFKKDPCEHGNCSEIVSACVPSRQGKHENLRVMDSSSFPGNHLEGQGQNILEREDERGKRRRVNEKSTHIKGCFEGLIEPSCKVSKDCSSENNVAKSSLEGHRHIDSFPNTSSGRKLGRDDDENLVNSTQLNSRDKIYSTPPDMHKLKYASSLMSDENNSRDNSELENLQRMYPFKKRKFFNQTSSSTSDRGSQCQGTFDSSDTTRVNDTNHAIEESSSIVGQQVHSGSKGCNVKLSIKSFKVPELFINIPETATIGSLKRTVMEAVTTILGNELHVGILLQGKKVRDDSKTLIQTGISQDEKHTYANNNVAKCRTLVAVPAINMEALAVVPFRRKSGNPDFAQRRIRRPFSVLEVEALVQAVEKLGTGRWRDVKQRAFDHAKHRTYVDLKDKWKTLVHTARISPQQRRGEPVPQELLDRVLAAHAYWSQQQW
ncbi:Telomere repeat-binding protein [Vigna angularis]|uniref:Telomere repeat-binding protein n=1 Tax=Phaseolus angularis TaxID=3914 RepID=A0A8T0L4M7_PHAAN|nr:Telomere repeat-binding protein [Vigna angularis]